MVFLLGLKICTGFNHLFNPAQVYWIEQNYHFRFNQLSEKYLPDEYSV